MKLKSRSNGNRRITIKSAPFLALSVLSLVTACFLRTRVSSFFITPYTLGASAHNLFSGYPPGSDAAVFFRFFSLLIRDFFTQYVPSMLLVGASIAFAAMAVEFNQGRAGKPSKNHTVKTAVILIVVSLIILIPMQVMIIGRHFSSYDEYSYLFQGQLLSQCRLYMQSPRPLDSFKGNGVVNNGKMFSKYTIGWPLLMAGGVLLKSSWLVNSFLAALAAAMVFLAGVEMFDYKTGLLAALLLLLSPIFTLNSLTLFPHTAQLLFLTAFIYLFFKSVGEKGAVAHCIGTGACLGFAFLIRPAETAMCGAVFFIPAMSILIKKKDRKKILLKYCNMVLAFFIMFGVFLLVNRVQTGSPFLMAFNVYQKMEKVGFGTSGHNAIRGLWNSLVQISRMFFWVPVLSFASVIACLFDRDLKYRVTLLFLPAVAVFFFFYFGTGGVEYGSRFYFTMLALLPIFSARGIIFIGRVLEEKKGVKGFAPVFSICVAVFMLFAGYPPIVGKAYNAIRTTSLRRYRALMESRLERDKRYLVFVRTAPIDRSIAFCLNRPRRMDRVIYALFLDPTTNAGARENYRDRVHVIVDYDHAAGKIILSGFRRERFDALPVDEKADIYLAAAYNYFNSLFLPSPALEYTRKAEQLAPGRSDIELMKASILMEKGKTDEATEILQRHAGRQPGLYFPLGVNYTKAGEYGKALKAFDLYLARNASDKNRMRVEKWREYALERERKTE